MCIFPQQKILLFHILSVNMWFVDRQLQTHLLILPPSQVESILDEFLEKLPEEFSMMELFARAEEKTPYVLVAL